MAPLVPSYFSEQRTLTNNLRGDRMIKTQDGGAKIRNYYAYFKNTTGGNIAAASVIGLMHIPGGRIIPHLSYILTSDFGGTATLSVGWNEHKENDTDVIVTSAAGIIQTLDVSGAAVSQFLSASASGSVTAVRTPGVTIGGFAEIIGTVNTDNMQANATIELYLAIALN